MMIISLLLYTSCNKCDGGIIVEPPVNMNVNIKMIVGSRTFTVSLYDNPTAKAFLTMLPMTISMGELNGNEKYYNLPNSLPTNSVVQSAIRNGDIMLYGSSSLVLFYETFATSYSYTRIGRVDNPSGLKMALGSGNVNIKFELE